MLVSLISLTESNQQGCVDVFFTLGLETLDWLSVCARAEIHVCAIMASGAFGTNSVEEEMEFQLKSNNESPCQGLVF